MKRKLSIVLALVLLLAMAACQPPATLPTGEPPATTASMTYAQAQQIYLNAWTSYHTAFTVLPEAQKAEWVKKYHPYFLTAATALVTWANDPSNAQDANAAAAAIDQVTIILLQLGLGGK